MLHVMVDYGSLKRDLSGLAKISYTQVYYLAGGGRPGPGEQMGSASYPVGCDAFVEVRELSALLQPRPRSASRSERVSCPAWIVCFLRSKANCTLLKSVLSLRLF